MIERILSPEEITDLENRLVHCRELYGRSADAEVASRLIASHRLQTKHIKALAETIVSMSDLNFDSLLRK